MRFDVLGQPIVARVTSVRQVNWRDSRAGGFMFVFRPGVLETAPHGFIAPVRGPRRPRGRARGCNATWSRQFPNVSVIDIRELLDTVRGVVANVTLGISAVGGLVLFSGRAHPGRRRRDDEVPARVRGGHPEDARRDSSRLVGSVLLVEYGLLGLLAGVVGAAGGAALSWAISRYVIESPWRPAAVETALGIVSRRSSSPRRLLASLDVLRRKPLATLRAE